MEQSKYFVFIMKFNSMRQELQHTGIQKLNDFLLVANYQFNLHSLLASHRLRTFLSEANK